MSDSTRPKGGGEGEISTNEKNIPAGLESGPHKTQPENQSLAAEIADFGQGGEVVAAIFGIQGESANQVGVAVSGGKTDKVVVLETRRRLPTSHNSARQAIKTSAVSPVRDAQSKKKSPKKHKAPVGSPRSQPAQFRAPGPIDVEMLTRDYVANVQREVHEGSLLAASGSSERKRRKEITHVAVLLADELARLEYKPLTTKMAEKAARNILALRKNEKVYGNERIFFMAIAQIILLQLWPNIETRPQDLDDQAIRTIMAKVSANDPTVHDDLVFFIYSLTKNGSLTNPRSPVLVAANANTNEGISYALSSCELKIERFPELVEWLDQVEKQNPGYQDIANVYCKMRIHLREKMIEEKLWEGAANELPHSHFWYKPLTLNEVVGLIESSDHSELIRAAEDTELTENQQDDAFSELFGQVAQNILLMERRFTRYGFDDEFIQNLCHQLIDCYLAAKNNKGIKQMIIEHMGDHYQNFLAIQAETRWGTGKKRFEPLSAAESSDEKDPTPDKKE